MSFFRARDVETYILREIEKEKERYYLISHIFSINTIALIIYSIDMF